jgi:restriction system protein
MAVPDFQSLMMPLLRIARDGQEHSLTEARDVLATEFKLSAGDRDELLPSGRQSKFSNRVAWAKSYLQQAGLLLSPRRGHFQISDRGREVLKSAPTRIDVKFLEQYPEFVEFRTPKGDVVEVPSQILSLSPEPETWISLPNSTWPRWPCTPNWSRQGGCFPSGRATRICTDEPHTSWTES